MKTRWSKSAGQDLRRITQFYRRIDPSLSAEMRRRIDTGVLRLCEFPTLGSPAPNGKNTKWSVPKTDFLLFFRIDGDLIIIDEVRHAREDWFRE